MDSEEAKAAADARLKNVTVKEREVAHREVGCLRCWILSWCFSVCASACVCAHTREHAQRSMCRQRGVSHRGQLPALLQRLFVVLIICARSLHTHNRCHAREMYADARTQKRHCE